MWALRWLLPTVPSPTRKHMDARLTAWTYTVGGNSSGGASSFAERAGVHGGDARKLDYYRLRSI